MTEFDQRLPVDLDHPVHRRLVHTRLHDVHELELREVADDDQCGWIGRAHEILLAFVRTAPAASTTSLSPLRAHQPVPPVQLPGDGEVLRMHLNTHPNRYDEILDWHLPRLLAALGQPMWWFTRHRELARPEAGQHLALTLHLTGDYGAAAAAVNAWATDLHHQRLLSSLTFESYRPQTGRYGTGQAMDAAHRVFAADSTAALAQIRLTSSYDIAPQSLTAVSLVDIAAHLLTSRDDAWTWLIERTPAHGRPDRTLREQAIQLYDAEQQTLALQGGAEIVEAWEQRARVLTAYRQALIETEHDPTTVLRSLFHHHQVRALGVGPTAEAATLHLARTIALRHRPIRVER
ncbi:thiopeptide-type bacteriocin biosynthesis protein [Streptomyces sp. WMMB303]|uniref:thiopeptide-type bacteriocin biosynthesis protein n=1 Tax=Streptomyces sp. WMMB303 TaxID=3034154 RepID=UPI0023EE2931|nr:thiopeptide-type bacteriocin biosynthesis protein [Streptomyces sp. WMMB303]MDF4250691.1 thiopeptide-type bacteriocin biosynthesis protein [Streptomyces sp. WMMB303]